MAAKQLQSLDDVIRELQIGYVQELPQKVKKILAHQEAGQMDLLGADFHRLKGTGATYGLPELSELAEIMVKICERRPSALPWVVPLATELIHKIHEKREKDQPCQIQTEEKYHEILLALTPME